MKFEDIQIIVSQKSCVIFTAVDLQIANILATLRKEFPIAKRQSATPTRFSTGIVFCKFVSCFFKFGQIRATKFFKIYAIYTKILAPPALKCLLFHIFSNQFSSLLNFHVDRSFFPLYKAKRFDLEIEAKKFLRLLMSILATCGIIFNFLFLHIFFAF